MYYWLVLVPILAHLLVKVPSVLCIPVIGTEVELNLTLPFSVVEVLQIRGVGL